MNRADANKKALQYLRYESKAESISLRATLKDNDFNIETAFEKSIEEDVPWHAENNGFWNASLQNTEGELSLTFSYVDKFVLGISFFCLVIGLFCFGIAYIIPFQQWGVKILMLVFMSVFTGSGIFILRTLIHEGAIKEASWVFDGKRQVFFKREKYRGRPVKDGRNNCFEKIRAVQLYPFVDKGAMEDSAPKVIYYEMQILHTNNKRSYMSAYANKYVAVKHACEIAKYVNKPLWEAVIIYDK